MNIIRIYEQRIRELLGFYVFRDMGNEINLLLFCYPVVIVPHLYMLEPVMTNLRTEQKINSRTKGMQSNLKVGDVINN